MWRLAGLAMIDAAIPNPRLVEVPKDVRACTCTVRSTSKQYRADALRLATTWQPKLSRARGPGFGTALLRTQHDTTPSFLSPPRGQGMAYIESELSSVSLRRPGRGSLGDGPRNAQ